MGTRLGLPLVVVAALIAGTATAAAAQGPSAPATCAGADCPSRHPPVLGTYGPTALRTADATVNAAVVPLGWFQAGTTIRVGTCGMPGATHTRNTVLRLVLEDTSTTVAVNDDNCAGHGSQIVYVVPHDMRLDLYAGCKGAQVGCGGAIGFASQLDAAPRPQDVKAAFVRVRNQGVLGISPDRRTLIRGINYQGDGFGEKYHFQGIARPYTRARYDLAWSTSVRADGGPQFHNVFFTRLGSKDPGRGERFGSNVWHHLFDDGNPLTPPVDLEFAAPEDAVVYGSNAGVYDGVDPGDRRDWDGIPAGRRFDHGGGIQAIGRYLVTASEFVEVEGNVPASGQASQVVLYDAAAAAPSPSLLISRRDQKSGWAAVARLGSAHTPPSLRGGYLVMVSAGDRLGLYAIPPDPCTGYVSLAQVQPFLKTRTSRAPVLQPLTPPTCPGPRTRAEQAIADVRPVLYAGCVRRVPQWPPPQFPIPVPVPEPEPDATCPDLVAMYEDGGRIDFPPQDDVQNVNFVTQADGRLYLLAFEGQQVELNGANSEVQLWRVVFGAASGADAATRRLPDQTDCQTFVCVVRAGTDSAGDSYKNMEVEGINGTMFRFGGGGYIVADADPARETFFVYGTEHYLQRSPRQARFNEF